MVKARCSRCRGALPAAASAGARRAARRLTSETDEFKRQSEAYMAAAMARGCPIRFVPMPRTSHYDIVFGLAEQESPLAHATIETMGLAAVLADPARGD